MVEDWEKERRLDGAYGPETDPAVLLLRHPLVESQTVVVESLCC